MADPCDHLEYRDTAGETSFEHERPFCTVVDEFVQPMRADICAARHGLDPAEVCEYYREEHDLGSLTGFDGSTVDASNDTDSSEADV